MKRVTILIVALCLGTIDTTARTTQRPANHSLSDEQVIYEERHCPRDCVCDLSIETARCRNLDPRVQGFSKSYIKTLIVHDVDRANQIKLDANVFKLLGLRYVNTIRIINTTIASVHAHAFVGLPFLTSVELIGNGLTVLDPMLFAANPRLKRVDLSRNPIRNAHEHLLRSDNIEKLYVGYADITHLNDTTLSKLPSLTLVDFSHNKISYVSAHAFAALPLLSEVHLEHNKIAKISHAWFADNREFSILNLKSNPIRDASMITSDSLETLDLTNCELVNINSDTFAGVPNLIDLILAKNLIRKITPDAFGRLTEMYSLDLSANLIDSLSDVQFYNNTLLCDVYVRNNLFLKALPTNGFRFVNNTSSIAFFDASHCGLTSVAERTFASMTVLFDLMLNNNRISFIHPKAFVHLPRISEVDLSGNQLQAMDELPFAKNTMLRRLVIAKNPWKTLNANTFAHLTNLIMLDASFCELRELWTNVPQDASKRLASLQYLNVSHNELSYVTTEQLSYVDSVKVFDIQNNPLQCDHMLSFMLNWLKKHDVWSTLPGAMKANAGYSVADYWDKLGVNMCNGASPPQLPTRIVERLDDHVERIEIDDAHVKASDEDEDDDDVDDTLEENEDNEDEDTAYNMNYDYDETTTRPLDFASVQVESLLMKHPYITLAMYLLGLLMSVVVITVALIHCLKNPPSRRVENIGIAATVSSKQSSGLVYQQLSEEY